MFLKSLVLSRLAHAYNPSNEGQDRDALPNLRPAWATQMEPASNKSRKPEEHEQPDYYHMVFKRMRAGG